MICPVCITAALVANAPAIAASLGGVAAVKLCLNQKATMVKAAPVERQQRQQPRVIVDPVKITRYDEQEW
ncbi:hypothetical protein HYH02_005767 [Chlamydomonas schloesseri]|uniref:Uncharacterized protein n=1 Tax=Chlamydomonas schloesseri TaxID=2026947 RepID=A0A835WKL5_9CHLO|nr:hypothetical protein HYH02_005767 [Chlamydomonas schloesseri]|eukprot:KAG2449013.1 hypothetical protein HYH02_005767 [Chlamydomonas schloesseri]